MKLTPSNTGDAGDSYQHPQAKLLHSIAIATIKKRKEKNPK